MDFTFPFTSPDAEKVTSFVASLELKRYEEAAAMIRARQELLKVFIERNVPSVQTIQDQAHERTMRSEERYERMVSERLKMLSQIDLPSGRKMTIAPSMKMMNQVALQVLWELSMSSSQASESIQQMKQILGILSPLIEEARKLVSQEGVMLFDSARSRDQITSDEETFRSGEGRTRHARQCG